jgi:hypothetical protein
VIRSLTAGLLATCAAAALMTAPGGQAAGRTLVLYSVGAAEQFVNNQDDRARGQGNNPFGNFADVTAVAQKSGNGPFAGDEAIFQLNLYSAAALRTKIGTATFTCQYGFDKRGFCDAAFALRGGILYGAGDFSFDRTTFTIPITGGSGRYSGARGVVTQTRASGHAQRLSFQLS